MADNSIKRLKSQLLKSGLQNKDQPLFQIINQLIDAVNGNTADIAASGSSSGGVSISGSFLTLDDEPGLPDSFQARPGEGIRFNKRTSKLIISGAYPLPDYNYEPDEIIPIPLVRSPNKIAYIDKTNTFAKNNRFLLNVEAGSITDDGNLDVTGNSTFTGSITGNGSVNLTNGLTVNSETITTSVLDLQSGGIKFPATQVPSADPNTLDDYEEGINTLTPTLVSSGGGAPTYTTQTGSFTKTGNQVVGSFLISLTNLGTLAAGTLTIAGLPFTASAVNGIPFLCIFASLGVNQIYIYNVVNPSTTSLLLRKQTAAAASNVADLTVADITNTFVIAGGFIYFV